MAVVAMGRTRVTRAKAVDTVRCIPGHYNCSLQFEAAQVHMKLRCLSDRVGCPCRVCVDGGWVKHVESTHASALPTKFVDICAFVWRAYGACCTNMYMLLISGQSCL
mgnify:CR=1 FL=1